MPYVDIQTIKGQVSCLELMQLRGWREVWKCGEIHRGQCPFHVSFSRRPRTFVCAPTWWYCHRCKTGGDVIDLYAALHALTFPDALAALGKLAPDAVSARPRRPRRGHHQRRPREEER